MRTIREIFNRSRVRGEVGIEVEVEGSGLPTGIITGWSVKRDGSLRNGLEYVTRGTVERENVGASLRVLRDALNSAESIEMNSRTSVHVHLNAQDLTEDQVYTWILGYLTLEPFLMQYCGPSREGNLFCLGALEATDIIDQLEAGALEGIGRAFTNVDRLKYAAINISALSLFGSLEFRGMRGTTDPDVIRDWVELLLYIKDRCLEFKSPRDLMQFISMSGSDEFVRRVIPKAKQEIVFESDMYPLRFYDAVRNCQQIAYLPRWDENTSSVFNKWSQQFT